MTITEITTGVNMENERQTSQTTTITVDNSLVSTVTKTFTTKKDHFVCDRKETFVTAKGKNKIVNVNKIEENDSISVTTTGNVNLDPIVNTWTVSDISKLEGVFHDNSDDINCCLHKETNNEDNKYTVKISRHDESPIIRTIMPRMFGYDICPDASDIELTGERYINLETGETDIKAISEINIKSGRLTTTMNTTVNNQCQVFPKSINTIYDKASGESGTSDISIEFSKLDGSDVNLIDIVRYIDNEKACDIKATLIPSFTNNGGIRVQTDITTSWTNSTPINETIVFFRDSINTGFAYRNDSTSEEYTIVMNTGSVFLLENKFVTDPTQYPKRFPFNTRSIIDVDETIMSEYDFDYTISNVNFNNPNLDISKMHNYIAFGREYIKFGRMGCVENMSTRARLCSYTPFIVENIDLFANKEFSDKYARIFRLCGFISGHWVMQHSTDTDVAKTYNTMEKAYKAFLSCGINEWQNRVTHYILETICGESTAKNIKNNMECIMTNLDIVLD